MVAQDAQYKIAKHRFFVAKRHSGKRKIILGRRNMLWKWLVAKARLAGGQGPTGACSLAVGYIRAQAHQQRAAEPDPFQSELEQDKRWTLLSGTIGVAAVTSSKALATHAVDRLETNKRPCLSVYRQRLQKQGQTSPQQRALDSRVSARKPRCGERVAVLPGLPCHDQSVKFCRFPLRDPRLAGRFPDELGRLVPGAVVSLDNPSFTTAVLTNSTTRQPVPAEVRIVFGERSALH